jgi:hypothetical protein
MFFPDQSIMGLRSQVNISGVQGDMNVEKKTDSLLQEGVSDRKAFLKFLSQAAETAKISSQSTNGQEGEPIHEEQTRKELLNFLRSELKLDNPDHPLEISTGATMSHLSESLCNIPCDTDIPELKPMIPGQPEEFMCGDEESDIETLLLQVFSFITENKVPDPLEFASGAGFNFETLENQTRYLPDTGKDSRQEPRTFLEQVLLASKDARELPRQEVNSPEAPVVKVVEAQAPLKHRAEESRTDTDLRQLVNLLTSESKEKPAVENEKSDAALKVFTGQDEKIQKGGNVFKNIHFNNSDGILQIPKESGHTISNPAPQALSTLDIQDNTNNLNSQIKTVAMSFDKDSYRAENNVLGQIVTRLFTGVRQGSQNMTIHLYPPELGRVKVRIVSDKGDLNVRLHSMNHQVAGILEKYLPILKQSLEDQGIVLSDLQVTVESGNQERSSPDEQGFWSADRELYPQKLSGENHDTGIIEINPGLPGPSQGLSLRI